MFPSFHIGSLEIQTYGLMILLAFIAGCLLVWLREKKFAVKFDAFFFVASALIGGVIGSKILYWIVEWKGFSTAFVAMFSGWENVKTFFSEYVLAGLVFYGGLIGGFLGAAWYVRRTRGTFSEYFNPVIPVLPLCHAIGRVGCFLSGCCYGRSTDSCIGVHFPSVAGNVFPTQLFEIGGNLLIFAALLLLCRPSQKRPWGLGWYAVMYAVMRFVVEFFRGDNRGSVGSLSTSQFIGIFIFIAGIALLVFEKQIYAFLDKLVLAGLKPAKTEEAAEEKSEDKPEQ